MCFYAASSMAVCLLVAIVVIQKFPQILKLIKSFDIFIEKSTNKICFSKNIFNFFLIIVRNIFARIFVQQDRLIGIQWP